MSIPRRPIVRVSRTLGDSLVELHHVDPGAPDDRGRGRWILVALGVAFLLVSLLAFARGVSLSAENKRALIHHIEIERRAVGDFRPRRLSTAHDLFAFGGLAGGILCLAAALAAGGRPRRFLTIGERGDVAWDGLVAATLIRPGPGGGAVVAIPAGATATITALGADGILEAREVGGDVALAAGERLRLEGPISALTLEWIEAPRPASLAAPLALEARTLAYLGGSALAFALLLALVRQFPPDGRTIARDEIGSDPRLVALVSQPREERPAEIEPSQGDGGGDEGPAAEAASAGEIGTTGDPDSSRDRGRMQIERRGEEITLEKAKEQILDAGALGVIRANKSRFASLTSTSPFASGLDERDVYGGIHGPIGPESGDWGIWGSEASFSNSPYADGWGTIAGKLPSLGGDHGGGYGTCLGGGSCEGGPIRRHEEILPTVTVDFQQAGCAVAGCDRDTIRRAIKRHRARFRHCYERALLTRPALRGTVETRFVISPEGKVQGARASGVDPELGQCVAHVISSIKFPRVSGGVPAAVTYPFRFYPVGR
jgi:hypothetical protein